MADISGLYPQPPAAAQPNVLASGDPSKVLGLIGQANQLQTFNATRAAGEAAQSAIGPDGTYDPTANALALRNNPNAALVAPEAIQAILAKKGQLIEQTRGQAQDATNLFGAVSNMDKPSALDVHKAAATAASLYPNLPPSVIAGISNHILNDPAGIKHGATTIQNMAIGAAGTSGRVAAPPAPSGAPQQQPLGAANYGGAQPTALPPGTPEAMQGSAQAYVDASNAANKYSTRVNPLRQAIPLLEGMKETDIGPTSDKWNDIKSTAITLGAGTLAGIDPQKIANVNELKKYFNQYASQAAATMGPKTNDGLATAVTSNPNIHMDKLSALDLSKVAMGVERMQQAGVLEFNDMVDRGQALPQNFNKFMADWSTKQDPRAFVYDLMTKEQQDKLKKTLPSAELNKIRNGMNLADRHGLLGDVHHNE
jgi:hypothetical protein